MYLKPLLKILVHVMLPEMLRIFAKFVSFVRKGAENVFAINNAVVQTFWCG